MYVCMYGNMDPINIPPMLAYISAPWILWDIQEHQKISRSVGFKQVPGRKKNWILLCFSVALACDYLVNPGYLVLDGTCSM